jgi:hypothetical protein
MVLEEIPRTKIRVRKNVDNGSFQRYRYPKIFSFYWFSLNHLPIDYMIWWRNRIKNSSLMAFEMLNPIGIY